MANSKLLYGSICLTDLVDNAKTGHSAFTRASNGKIYANINIWLNDEKDKFGNDASIQLNPAKESEHKKEYVGNAKYSERIGSEPIKANDVPDLDGLELPF